MEPFPIASRKQALLPRIVVLLGLLHMLITASDLVLLSVFPFLVAVCFGLG